MNFTRWQFLLPQKFPNPQTTRTREESQLSSLTMAITLTPSIDKEEEIHSYPILLVFAYQLVLACLNFPIS